MPSSHPLKVERAYSPTASRSLTIIALERIRARLPQLTQTAVPFLYRSKEAELYAERPLIQLSCRGDVTGGSLQQPFAIARCVCPRTPARHSMQLPRFAALLRNARFIEVSSLPEISSRFDNQRTFTVPHRLLVAKFPRHLRGCYLARDSV